MNTARKEYDEDVDKAMSKNTAKMDQINQKSTSGKAQATIRENIKNHDFEDAFEYIGKVRRQMDSDYNSLEKQLDELEANQESFIEKYKTQLQLAIEVKDFSNIDSMSNELKERLTLLMEKKTQKVADLKEKLENNDLMELLGKQQQPDLTEEEMAGMDTKVYHDKLLELFEAIIKQYMTEGFIQIEKMRQATEDKLEDVFDREKKTAKVFNKMLDELSELEDYATEQQEKAKEELRNAPFIEIQQIKKDRVGEFFADLTLNNQNRKKREVVIETKKKGKKPCCDDDNCLPEGLQIDDDEMIVTNQKNVGDIDLFDMKKKKN